MKNFKSLMILCSTAGLIISFQNCAPTSFGQAPSGVVFESSGTSGDPRVSINDPVTNTDATSSVQGTAATDKTEMQRSFVCVLAGSGKSTKLVYEDDTLGAANGTPSDICMSAKACSEIVSQKFDVQGPQERGFCPNKNPHVVEFTDDQVQALINKI